MKHERLDQILLRLGYVNESEIEQALLRQKAHGGRLGTQLLFFKFITEGELVHALSEQYEIPGFKPEEHEISTAAVKTIPLDIAEDYEVLPIQHDTVSGVVTVVAANPDDHDMITKIKQSFLARHVRVLVAPEALLQILVARYYRGEKDNSARQIIELPELFDRVNAARDVDTLDGEAAARRRNVIVVSTAKATRNFLAPIFEREGLNLVAASGVAETREALGGQNIERVLVAENLIDEFSGWIRAGEIPVPQTEVSTFATISGALLENPIPYKKVAKSLFRSLQLMADARRPDTSWAPPYGLIGNDTKRLARSFGFSSVAIDAMQMISYLLIPSRGDGWESAGGHLNLVAPDQSLTIAKALEFPWDMERTLRGFLELVYATNNVTKVIKSTEETMIGAQILAIVWYHHTAARPAADTDTPTWSGLRDWAGRLASLEIVEAYIRLLEQEAEKAGATSYNQIFIVSRADEMATQFSSRLGRLGFHTLGLKDLVEAQRLCERRAPVAVLIDRDSYAEQTPHAARVLKLSSSVLIYAFTAENDPSLTLDLLDAGCDDVLSPPYNYDVITARLSKSISTLTRKSGLDQKGGGFSATFDAFSLIDLLQALGQSLKSVRIDFENSKGETGLVFLRRGRIAHAACGTLTAEQAVYRIIAWGDDGSFRVEPTDDFPEDNVSEANEAILMEGCRLLDESEAPT